MIQSANPIYLDYGAATPCDEEVIAVMQPYFSAQFYNPSSSYLAARQVGARIEDARARVAAWLGAKPAEIIFTAGATEANNLAVRGLMAAYPTGNVLVGAIEHESLVAPAQAYAHQLIPVTAKGMVDVDALYRQVDDRTVLIAVGYANNEIGTIQPLAKIAGLVAKVRQQRQAAGNSMPLYLHADATQATPYLDLHTARLGVDLMTINGGKMYGPKQMGALFVSSQVVLHPQVGGGGQERGLRSGTENVPGIIGLATALDVAQQNRKVAAVHEKRLRDYLLAELRRYFGDLVVNGDLKKRLPNNLNVSWPGLDGERILMMADERGLQIATGAACSANKQTGSHVLRAIGLSEAEADGSIRLTLGRHTTEADITRAAAILKEIIETLQ